MYYYSFINKGFYSDEVHGTSLPTDATLITDAEYQVLLTSLSKGDTIVSDPVTSKPVPQPPTPPTFAEIQATMKNKILAKREALMLDGYQVGTDWFQSDLNSKLQLLGLFVAGANIPLNTQWKTMTGTFVPVTQALAAQIFSTASNHENSLFAAAETHIANMLASATPETYDFSTGWPVTFSTQPAPAPTVP